MIDFNKIEKKWQKEWDKAKLGEAEVSAKKKFFMIFAYPGISGYLHVGHMRGFSYTDMICRYKRMKGFNVLFPVGTHASGNQAIAFAKKVRNKDREWINYLKDNGCPASLIPKLTKPEAIVKYFNDVYVEEYWKRFGFLADFRRFACTIDATYGKFIQWQFRKLYSNNLLTQKPYFATFCPECGPVAVDPSETDISKGGNAEKKEFILLKFKFDDIFLIAATLRPDTVFGQTNMWIDPDVNYVKAEVGNEIWVLSKEAAEKLGYQKDKVKVIGKISGKKLIGKYAHAPGAERDIIILPSKFCNPDIGSGIVTSVPSDAPWDYIALRDLQHNKKECDKYNLDFEEVKAIKPISTIKCRGYGEFPAIELCDKKAIVSQKDSEKIENLTKEIYKQEFHTGVLTDSCGKYAGKKVDQAIELIKEDLISSGKADIMHDLSEEVVCRCGGKVIIKRIDDQWFIKYSDNELTEKSKLHVSGMDIYPKEYHRNLSSVLNWFMDRACARLGNWLGTKLPFDEKWTIEPISDSTLYPMFYIISKYVNDGSLKIENLTEEFFDYVFLGKGRLEKVVTKTGVKSTLLKKIKGDFEYWYPLNINLGGKEHQTVHFPVFIMNHVGILDDKYWPRGIFVNYWIVGRGSKISKSKGGAVAIPGAIKKFSVDGMRLYYAHVGSANVDVEWSEDIVFKYRVAVERIYGLAESLFFCKTKRNKNLDKWLESKTHNILMKVDRAMEKLDFREATNLIYFNFYDTLRWYQRRGGCDKKTLKDILEIFVRMLVPFTPHTAEELWHNFRNKSLVSSEKWPEYDEGKIDLGIEAEERMLKELIYDIRTVIKLSKIKKPKEVTIYVMPDWRRDLCRLIKKQIGITKNPGEIIREIMKDENLRSTAKDDIGKAVMFFIKNPKILPQIITIADEELAYLKYAKDFLKQEFNTNIKVDILSEKELKKPLKAMRLKPVIVVKG